MATLGERMKRERENRGVSLSEISKATNIQSKHLSALEEDDFDALPGPVFVTGFLRAYSHHLGLDADELLIEYELLKTSRQLQSEPSPTTNSNKGKFSVATIIAVLAIATFLLYLGWSGGKTEKLEEPVRAVKEAGEIKKLPPIDNHAEKITVSPVEESDQHEEFPDTPDIPEIDAPKPEPVSEREQIEMEPESLPPAFTSAVRKKMKTKYRLVVSAKDEDVWVFVEVDGETTHNLFVRAGQSIALRADKSITLTSGNAKSMKLTLNGNQLDFKTTPNIIREWSLPLSE